MENVENENVKLDVLIPKEDKAKLLEVCKEFDTDLSKLIRKLIRIYLVNRKK